MCSGRFRFFVAIAVPAAVACGDSAGSGGADGGAIDGLVSIAVEPADATFVIDGDEPAAVDYTAIGIFEDGSERDLTSQARFSLGTNALGRFEGSSFESTTIRGGASRVSASAGGVSGSTSITLVLRKRYEDPGSADDLPEDPGAAFEGDEDAERAPQLVYPNDGVLVPPNLRELEFHFLPGEGNELFELSFENQLTDIVLYLRCPEEVGEGCVYEPDATLWNWVAQTNRGAEPVEVTLRATDDAGTGVGISNPLAFRVSFDELRGAIYYWTTSGDTAIMRYDFGDSTQQEAEVFMEPTFDSGETCVGCHALSPDGSKVVAELGGQWDGRLVLFDVIERELIAPVTEPRQSVFQSWNPDGSQFVGVFMDPPDSDTPGPGADDYNLLLFDGETAEQTGRIDVGADENAPANHPDWSPDGSRIVFNRVAEPDTNQRSSHGEIQMITYQGDDEWSDPVTLVPREDGTNYYYPAFTPDSEYIIFNRSYCESGNSGSECDQDMDPTATLLMMRAEPGAEPVELENANAPGVMDDGEVELYNSFPRWSPFEFQRTEEFGTRLQWVTFSSKRNYGLRELTDSEHALLWMAGVDPDRAGAGLDPSLPAFAIPYQDLDTSNHIAQWAEAAVIID